MATKKQKLVMEDYVEKLDLLDADDCEAAHAYADDYVLQALRDLGFGGISDAYDRVVERARWWATA